MKSACKSRCHGGAMLRRSLCLTAGLRCIWRHQGSGRPAAAHACKPSWPFCTFPAVSPHVQCLILIRAGRHCIARTTQPLLYRLCILMQSCNVALQACCRSWASCWVSHRTLQHLGLTKCVIAMPSCSLTLMPAGHRCILRTSGDRPWQL